MSFEILVEFFYWPPMAGAHEGREEVSETLCPFCSPNQAPQQHIVLENETCYFLQHDRHQDILEGSGVSVPKAHRPTTFDLTVDEWRDLRTLLLQARAFLAERYRPDGYTLAGTWGPSPIKKFRTHTFMWCPVMWMSHTREKGFVIG